MTRFRHRSSSVGSYQSGNDGNSSSNSLTIALDENLESAKSLVWSLFYLRDSRGKPFLHTLFNLAMAKGLLDRAKSLDELRCRANANDKDHKHLGIFWQRRFLLQVDRESGYTPFHQAIMERNLSVMLLILRQAMNATNFGGTKRGAGEERLTQRPMTILHAAAAETASKTSRSNTSGCNDLLYSVAMAKDREGLTPLDLLGRLQIGELARCRRSLTSNKPRLLPQRPGLRGDTDEGREGELNILSDHMGLLQLDRNEEDDSKDGSNTKNYSCDYACEVVTFGRPHHCALGVISSSSCSGRNIREDHHASTFCPQRVQEFAQERIGRGRSAVAVAAATHHTLVVTKDGHLYAFGLGKGGRLGIPGENHQQCPLPRRVLGPLARQKVVGVAAAENHSLCVTIDGAIYAWGSNRFGQLGEVHSTTTATTTMSASTNLCRWLPRRVEDMKNVPCVAVAAGEKHSVALSRKGEVYVWGDNTSGQLGVPRRSGIQKPQRVEALWRKKATSVQSYTAYHTQPKIAIAIAAAEHSTLVLTTTSPNNGTTASQFNAIYSWGHGNHVPIRVHFENDSDGREQQQQENFGSFLSTTRRVVNPVAIACAKYHNAAITSDGQVYTWGLHAESLGRTKDLRVSPAKEQKKGRSYSSDCRSTSSPQLVSGMLPENGGGFAVALAASEQHTAIITDTGALYTWGTTHGKNVLGHEGVRWQPSPKRVPGVHRAVNVAVAKEHTVLLIGASYPKIPSMSSRQMSSLELLSARTVAEHVDLFNVIPILIVAKRMESCFLIDYCKHFIHRNFDGVLNVSKKSVMDQYLNDMLADNIHCYGERFRDDHHHPFITDVITAGNTDKPKFTTVGFSTTEEWASGCKELVELPNTRQILAFTSAQEHDEEALKRWSKSRRSSSCTSSDHGVEKSISKQSGSTCNTALPNKESKESSLDKCKKTTPIMDDSIVQPANDKSVRLGKEIRGVKKKLDQIDKLQESDARSIVLSTDQRLKVDRRPFLEAELDAYERTLDEVEQEIKFEVPSQRSKKLKNTLVCDICGIKCPDKTSFELHQNGRKHRNRVTQANEEEKRKKAASIAAQHHLEQTSASNCTPRSSKKGINVWGVPSVQPKYKLPPPPNPVVSQVIPVTQRNLKKSSISPTHNLLRNSTELTSPSASFRRFMPEEASSPMKKLESSPIRASSPGSSRCVPLAGHTAPALTRSSQAETAKQKTYLLADFFSSKPSPPSTKKSVAPWYNKKEVSSTNKKSLAVIQAEEVDFKTRQDKRYEKGGEGRWFIERKERADSLLSIQHCAEKEREERLLIEEQLQIEAQITNELAMKREKGGETSQPSKNRPSRKKEVTLDPKSASRKQSMADFNDKRVKKGSGNTLVNRRKTVQKKNKRRQGKQATISNQ